MAAIPRYPCTSYNLGIPAPANTPTVAVVLAKQDQAIEDITDDSNPINIKKTAHDLATGQRVYIENIVDDDGNHPSAMSSASPCVITFAGHGLETGDQVDLYGFSNDFAPLNTAGPNNDGIVTISRINSSTFSVPVDSTGWVWDSTGFYTLQTPVETNFHFLNGNTYTITKVDADNFTLGATDGTDRKWRSGEGGQYDLKPLDDNTVSTAYVYTYSDTWGQEGPPSDPSDIVDAAFEEDDTVTITNTSAGPGAGYNTGIMTKNLYRISSAGEFANTYQLVESGIALAAQPASDGVTDDDLGDPIETLDFDPPPSDMAGIKSMPNGIAVAFSGRDVCFCEPFLPHAWPTKYRVTLDFEIVGLGVIGNSVVVVTLGLPYIVTGSHPNNMSIEKLEINQACVAKESIVDMGTGIIYASNDGLVYITTAGAQLLTDKLIDPLVWRATSATGGWEPATIIANYYEGRYVAKTSTGGNRFDFLLELTDLGINLSKFSGTSFGDCMHNDLEDDKLYAVISSNIKQIEGSADNLALFYETKKIRTPGPVNFGCMQVWADSYPGTSDLEIKVYADDVLKHTETPSSNDPFRLPAGFMSENWEITISSKHEIQQIIMAEAMEDLRRVV